MAGGKIIQNMGLEESFMDTQECQKDERVGPGEN